jgi:hypothetical protein
MVAEINLQLNFLWEKVRVEGYEVVVNQINDWSRFNRSVAACLQKNPHRCEAERSELAGFNRCPLHDLRLENNVLVQVGLIGVELGQHLLTHSEAQLIRGLGNGSQRN